MLDFLLSRVPRLSPALKTALVLAASLGAPLFILYFINQFAVNVPYIDEWSFTRVIYAYRQGQLTLGMFLEPHNGHIIAFPRLVMLGMAVLARRWNIIAELYANVILCGACVFAWWAVLRPHVPPRVAAGAVIICSWLIFSLIHALNWFMGFQITWVMAFAAACALALVGSFSMAGGLLIWLVGVGMLVFARRGVRLVIWCALAALSIALFLRFTNGSSSMAGPGSIPKIAEFVAVMLGAPFGVWWGEGASLAFGAFGLFALVVLLFWVMKLRLARTAWMPWVAFAALAILQAALTAVGRVEKSGTHIALSSHYALFGLLFWIGLAGVLALLGSRVSRRGLLWLMALPLAAIFGVGYITASLRGYGDLAFMNRRAVLAQAYLLSNASVIPDEVLQNVHWNVDTARLNVAQLREVNEGVFGTAQGQAAALRALQTADQSASIAAAIDTTSSQLPASRIKIVENAPAAQMNADGVVVFQRVVGQLPTFDIDLAPLAGGTPKFLVIETRRAGVIDVYLDVGDGLPGAYPSGVAPNANRFVVPLPAKTARAKIVLHYIAGSPLDESVRFVLVEGKASN